MLPEIILNLLRFWGGQFLHKTSTIVVEKKPPIACPGASLRGAIGLKYHRLPFPRVMPHEPPKYGLIHYALHGRPLCDNWHPLTPQLLPLTTPKHPPPRAIP